MKRLLKPSTKKKIAKEFKSLKRKTKRILTEAHIRRPRKNPITYYPFLWSTHVEPTMKIPSRLKRDKYYVVIAHFNLNYELDPYFIGVDDEYVLHPEINIIKDIYPFDTEQQALEYIKEWWINESKLS